MPDLHDTIVRLKSYAKTTRNYVVIRRKTIEEAIELLKEQDEQIKTLSALAKADGIDVDALF